MNDNTPERIVLMLSIILRGKSKQYIEMLNKKNIRYHLQSVGFGTAPSEMMDIFGLGSNDKDIIFSLAPTSTVADLATELSKNIDTSSRYGGLLMVLSLSSINRLTSEILNRGDNDNRNNSAKGTKSKMKSERKHQLIAISVNQGYTEEVMQVAKQAGATGGTVIRARVAGPEKLDQLTDPDAANTKEILGEKEIITVLVPSNIAKQIMEEINEKFGMTTEAQGVVCSLPIEKAFKI